MGVRGEEEPDEAAGPLPAGGSPGRGRPWRPRLVDLVLVALVLWLLLCGATLRRARSEAAAGVAAVRHAERFLAPADLVRGRALRPLTEAGVAFRRSHRGLNHPVLAPLRILPIMGRQIRSASALTGAATEVAGIGGRAVRDARTALEDRPASGPDRVSTLRRVAAVAARAGRELDGVDLGPGRALVGPLEGRRAELAQRLDEAQVAMVKASRVATGLADLLGGPKRYLVVAANNAEMRAGSGMFLSVGELSFAEGRMTLGEFRPTGDLVLDPAVAPPIEDPDLQARWGWLNPNREWRNLAASPRFAASAQLAARMWVANGGAPVDGVLMLDPVALQALLSSTGPVKAGGRTISADEVLPLLLHDQYADIETLADADQAGRRELLGSIAASTIGALEGEDLDVASLSTALRNAVQGRHLLAWAPDDRSQLVWETAGVSGALEADSLVVSVLNRAGNKLDQFLEVDAHLRIRRSKGQGQGELRVTLRNRTPEGEVGYIAGLNPASGVAPGDYSGLLSVNLPGFVEEVKVESAPTFAAAGPDGPTTVVAWPVRIDRGSSVTEVIRFRLPAAADRHVVEPSARVPAIEWTAQGRSWTDNDRHQVRW